jgi:CheY-like chemotaxis protein
LDINLPGLDAWDFIEQLSAHGKQVSDLPLVLLSSHISPSDRQKIQDYDLHRAVLTKPLRMEALMELIVQ